MLAKAWRWQKWLEGGRYRSIRELAEAETGLQGASYVAPKSENPSRGQRSSFVSLGFGVSSKAILNIVADNKIKLFLGKTVMLTKCLINLINDRLRFLDLKRLRFGTPRLFLHTYEHCTIMLNIR